MSPIKILDSLLKIKEKECFEAYLCNFLNSLEVWEATFLPCTSGGSVVIQRDQQLMSMYLCFNDDISEPCIFVFFQLHTKKAHLTSSIYSNARWSTEVLLRSRCLVHLCPKISHSPHFSFPSPYSPSFLLMFHWQNHYTAIIFYSYNLHGMKKQTKNHTAYFCLLFMTIFMRLNKTRNKTILIMKSISALH